MEKKQQQKVIPNPVNVKSDLHRLRLILQKENLSKSANTHLNDRYQIILKKARQQQQISNILVIDENASSIIENEKLEEFCSSSSGVYKPVK